MAKVVEKKAHLNVVSSQEVNNPSDLSDDDLMLLLRRDHIQAFETLVGRHQEMVLGFACRFLGDRDLGEEVGQEVFLTLWAERMRYQTRGRFKSYLLALAYNRCHVFARQRQRHRRKLEKFEVSAPRQDTDNTPLEQMVDSVRGDEVRRALVQLPEPMRRAIVLRYNSGLAIKEIAEATGTPPGTVKSNLFRGLKRLHELFTGGNP
ncbi:RNA polymerase sigma factor [Myxococcota bacterium]